LSAGQYDIVNLQLFVRTSLFLFELGSTPPTNPNNTPPLPLNHHSTLLPFKPQLI